MVKVNSEEVRSKAIRVLGHLVYLVFSDQSMTMDGSFETRDYVGDVSNDDDDDDDGDDYCYVIEDKDAMIEYLLATEPVFIGEHGTKMPLTELTGEYILQHHKVVITDLPAARYCGYGERTNTATIYIEDGDIIAEYKQSESETIVPNRWIVPESIIRHLS